MGLASKPVGCRFNSSVPHYFQPRFNWCIKPKNLAGHGATRRRELGDKEARKGISPDPEKMSCEKDRKAGWQVDVDEKDRKT